MTYVVVSVVLATLAVFIYIQGMSLEQESSHMIQYPLS